MTRKIPLRSLNLNSCTEEPIDGIGLDKGIERSNPHQVELKHLRGPREPLLENL